MSIQLVPCPFCGVLLTASLVASIRDPKQEERCPKQGPVSRVTDGTKLVLGSVIGVGEAAVSVNRLASLMMLGARS